MKWTRASLRAKLALTLAIIMLIATSSLFLVTQEAFNNFIETEIQQELDSGERTLSMVLAFRQTEALAVAQAIALKNDIWQGLIMGDMSPAFPQVEMLMARHGLDYVVIADANGDVVFSNYIMAGPDDPLTADLSTLTQPGTEETAVLIPPLSPYPIITASTPIHDPQNPEKILGTVITGYALDKTFLDNLAQNLNLDLSVIVDQQRILSTYTSDTSLPDTIFTDTSTTLSLNNHLYRIRYVPLNNDSNIPQKIGIELAISVTTVQEFFSDVWRVFIISGLISGILAFIVAIWLAHRLIRPLHDLTQAAYQLGAGNLTQRVAISGEDEIGVLAHAFNQMAADLEQAHQTEKAYADRLRFLDAINRAILAARDPQEIAHAALIHLSNLIPCERVSVVLLDNEQGSLQTLAAHGTGPQMPLTLIPTEGFKEQLKRLQNGEIVILGDVPKMVAHEPALENVTELGIETAVLLPLIAHQQLIGTLNIGLHTPHMLDTNHLGLARRVADQLAIAIQNARLTEETRLHAEALEKRVAQKTAELSQSLAETQALYQVSQTLAETTNLEHLLQMVTNTIARVLDANRVILYLLDIENKEVLQFVKSGPGADKIDMVEFSELWEGLTGWVIRHRQPALSPKGKPDERESPRVQAHRQRDEGGSIVVVPVIYQEHVLGTLTVINLPSQPDFTKRDVALISAMANQTAVAIQNARLFTNLQQSNRELKKLVDLMAGREIRMAELKKIIRALHSQLREHGLEPVADDPFIVS
ncbi:MAG: GAF domain-containing protein [Chloroflexi bacterium]|nr:MAG: GAF domain-containing protein [Chloroflexota bacterium]